MNQERKKELAVGINKVLKKYNMKGTLSVQHYSTLIITLREWVIDFSKYRKEWTKINWIAQPEVNFTNHHVNHFWIKDNWNGIASEFLTELKDAMMVGNHDNSDSMTDYFDVGRYISINIGDYDKPYKVVEYKEVEPIKAWDVEIVDYSEKAIAVIWDTKPIKDKLKELGWRFNFRLSCGAGWIFPKTKLDTVKTALSL